MSRPRVYHDKYEDPLYDPVADRFGDYDEEALDGFSIQFDRQDAEEEDPDA